jgi:hypothetical protein
MRAGSFTIVGLLGLWLGGCGDANSGQNPAGGAGASTAGGSAGTGGTVGAAGGGNALVDPPAAEPDMTGLVTTSAKWILVTGNTSAAIGNSLDFVDLESGTHYPVNSTNQPVAYGYWSPDQKSFVFSGANGASDKNLSIVRLAKNGFVPARLISGYEGTFGAFSLLKWDESSRFFAAARSGSMSSGVEIVDAVLGKRLGHVDFAPSFGYNLAPKGLYFGWLHGDASAYDSGMARIVKDGISAPTALPAGAYAPQFSSDGKRAFFGRKEGDLIREYYLDLPDTTPKELKIAAEGEKMNGSASPGPTADSVIAYVQKTDADRQYVRAFVDGRPRVLLSDPAKKVRFAFESNDHNIHAVDYETSLEIVRAEPYVRLPLPGLNQMDAANYWTAGIVGQHVYHQVGGRLYVASIDAGGALQDVAVGEPGENVSVCEFYISHEPTTKLAYRTVKDDVAQLVVVDLAASPPAVSVRLTASAPGNGLYCPDFSLDESAMVVSEAGAASANGGKAMGKLYGVKWAGGVASQPEVLFEAEGTLQARAFSY